MKNYYILLGMLAALWSAPAYAQEEGESKFELKAQIRPRAEFRNGSHGLKPEGADPAFFINNRARLSAYYTDASGKLKVGMSGQNVSVWGATPQTEMEGSFMLNEAWAEYAVSNTVAFKIGRQQAAYDDDRILGTLDWHVAGRWHDMFLTKVELNDFQAHLGLAYSQNGENKFDNLYTPSGQPYKSMQYLWTSYKFSEQLSATALFMNLGFQKMDADGPVSGLNNLQTVGTNWTYKNNGWMVYATYYHQFGNNNGVENVNANLAAVKVAYNAQGSAWTFTGGLDYVSGNDEEVVDIVDDNGIATGEQRVVPVEGNKSFDPLYGTHHKFYGFMDYFYVGNHGRSVGLFDKNIGTTYKVNPKLAITGTLHHFNSAASIKNEQGGSESTYLGTELDLSFAYKVAKDVTLVGGFSQMFAGEQMELLYPTGNSSNGQNWAWLSVNINPTIFATTFK
ncbi:alginate export family protein [Persicobacter sp. CCB-QB2]|uniref:alginate export family protein n=1 Tax=Persicobacter sp. CCB-QB2 TaxID=1561025 RepID=UPI0006A987DF|nr:alginate export family protein [Persicobacter sp. CCB-QB2]